MKWTAKVVEAIISLMHGPARQGICVTGTIHGPPVPGSLFIASPCPGRQSIETNLYTQPLNAVGFMLPLLV